MRIQGMKNGITVALAALCVFALQVVSAHGAAGENVTTYRGTDTPPALRQIEQLRVTSPPSTRTDGGRIEVIKRIDDFIASTAVAERPEFVAFYRKRVDLGLASLE